MTDSASQVPVELVERKTKTKEEKVNITITGTLGEAWHDFYTGLKNGGWKTFLLFVGFIFLLIYTGENAKNVNTTEQVILALITIGLFFACVIVFLLERKDKARIAVFEVEGHRITRGVKIDPHDEDEQIQYDDMRAEHTSISIWDYPESLIKTGNKYDESYKGVQLVQCLRETDRNTKRSAYIGAVRPHKWYVQGDPIPGLASLILVKAVSEKFAKISKKWDKFIKKLEKKNTGLPEHKEILEINRKFQLGVELLTEASDEVERLKHSPIYLNLENFGKYTKRFVIGVALAEDYHNIKRLERMKDPSLFTASNLSSVADQAARTIITGLALESALPWVYNNAFTEFISVFAGKLTIGADQLRELEAFLRKPAEMASQPPDKKGLINVRER